MMFRTSLSALAMTLFFGCSSSSVEVKNDDDEMRGTTPDASLAVDVLDAGPVIDGRVLASELPGWTLEDIQPESTRFGEVYGLSAFSGKILIALLLDGF